MRRPLEMLQSAAAGLELALDPADSLPAFWTHAVRAWAQRFC